MAELNVDLAKLPEDVREKLAELDLELSEGKVLSRLCDFDVCLLTPPAHLNR